MSEKSRPEEIEKPEERLLVVVPALDERRWWELQLGVRLLGERRQPGSVRCRQHGQRTDGFYQKSR